MQQGLRWLLVFTLLATFIVVTPSAVRAATLTVENTNDDGPNSLRQAVFDASANDVIEFELPGDGPHTIILTSGQITITKNLTISGPGAAQLTIARGGTVPFRIFESGPGTEVTISGLTVSNGSGEYGGAILNIGTLNLTSSTISGNTSLYSGGGIENRGTLNLTSSTISNNTTSVPLANLPIVVNGGGIYNSGILTITNSTINDNRADATHATQSVVISGGGIYNAGSGNVTLTNSTINGNRAAAAGNSNLHARGGGIYNAGSGNVTLTNSTINDNMALASGFEVTSASGGGIYNAGTVDLTSTTISRNTALGSRDSVLISGGGIYNAATLNLTSSIVAGNTGGSNIEGTFTPDPNSLTSGDPKLDDPADNGGPTWTMLPKPDSPAINTGGNTCPEFDQRGVDRPQGTACDIGAVEVRVPTITVPANMTIPATGPAGTEVEFIVTATSWEGESLEVTCDPESGTLFSLDVTPVDCMTVGGTMENGGVFNPDGSFTVTVTLPDGPVITVPDDMLVEATSPDGAVVTFSPTATDWSDAALTVICDPASGDPFPLGETAVECSATDAFDRTVEDSFTVTVQDTTAPVLSQPGNLTVAATGPTGAVVYYDLPEAIDAVDENVTVNCSPPPGALFATGTTPVTCSASDTDPVSFTITVLDGRQQLGILISDVRAAPVSFLIKPRLLIMLQMADLSLRRGQTATACTLLNAFSSTVSVYGATRLVPPATATELRADAVQIRAALGCR